jgi:hypothetical protein
MHKINKKIIICSTIKNEEKKLKFFFNKIESISKHFEDVFYIFVESDSKDKSYEILNNFTKLKKGITISIDTSAFEKRTKRLEICRNTYLNYIQSNKDLINYDYLFVIDADFENYLLDINKIYNSIKNNIEWSALLANQIFLYYDVWALRIKNLIEFDCFEEFLKNLNSSDTKPSVLFRDKISRFYTSINKFSSRFIKVDSAFGGFGIYNIKKIIECSYNSSDGINCEHVGLSKQLNNKYGNLYIDKKLTNSYGINTHTLNGILCSYHDYFAYRFKEKIK